MQSLFEPVVTPARLHPNFRELTGSHGFAPARALMQHVFDAMGDRDGNFVQQFQTDGFNSRTWELYLYATFASLKLSIDMTHAAPDFLLEGRGVRWAVEATTANPSTEGDPVAPDDLAARARYLREELPIRLGSSLLSKARRAYWDQHHVAGQPFVIAVQSFATADSLHFADTALVELLFGVRTTGTRLPDGTLDVVSTPISEHMGSKVIPSNFFGRPDTKGLSAVMWSNSGTVAKFGRMAYQQGLASAGLRMKRIGVRHVMDPNASEPATFEYEVGARFESWAEGLTLVHNPNATWPLPYEALPEAAHHRLEGGRVVSTLPAFHAYNSVTITEVQTQSR